MDQWLILLILITLQGWLMAIYMWVKLRRFQTLLSDKPVSSYSKKAATLRKELGLD